MTTDGAKRRVLIVGGTGMLAPFCRMFDPNEVVLAARFTGNVDAVARLSKRILRVVVDYRSATSRETFLARMAEWPDLTLCVLWVHSPSHDFSQAVIAQLARRPAPPLTVHVFGSGRSPGPVFAAAHQVGAFFIPVQLGHADTPSGPRWLTHDEISRQVAEAIPPGHVPSPDLGGTKP